MAKRTVGSTSRPGASIEPGQAKRKQLKATKPVSLRQNELHKVLDSSSKVRIKTSHTAIQRPSKKLVESMLKAVAAEMSGKAMPPWLAAGQFVVEQMKLQATQKIDNKAVLLAHKEFAEAVNSHYAAQRTPERPKRPDQQDYDIARARYVALRDELEESQPGKWVAIDVDSDAYALGDDSMDAKVKLSLQYGLRVAITMQIKS